MLRDKINFPAEQFVSYKVHYVSRVTYHIFFCFTVGRIPICVRHQAPSRRWLEQGVGGSLASVIPSHVLLHEKGYARRQRHYLLNDRQGRS